MQINDFKSIVATFADPGTEMLFEKTRILIQVNGDLIEALIGSEAGDVYVDEGTGKIPASKWVMSRLGRLPLLASRLVASVPETEHFVSPSATHLPTLEEMPDEDLVRTDDALSLAIETLDGRSPLETMVLYLTSDAGEGKTSLINELARKQAKRFVANETQWLLVPIPLGGRHFMRFDDITIGALQNRYRFPFLYYNSFLALVRMGVIVPAFDGFEEMFVESSSGEALSAMGILVDSMESQGSMIVAARKAYFEFENLQAQERLFDSIRGNAVEFGKIELERWGKCQFVAYCNNRGVSNSEELYHKVSERLGEKHALLTRAVLVKRLIDISEESSSLDSLLEKLSRSGADFFSVFVRSLIEREANEKWIDRSGKDEVGAALLNADEHCDLLSMIALSMWESRVDYLKRENLEFVADYFSDVASKNAFQAQQIKGRIRGHAMMVPSSNSDQAVEFDHDEFRHFFLGEGIAKQLNSLSDRAKAEVHGVFRRGLLPKQSQHSFLRAVMREIKSDPIDVVKFLLAVSSMDVQASYTQQNCSDIVIRMLSGIDGCGLEIHKMAFGIDSLRDRKLSNVVFVDCYFSPSSLELTEWKEVAFNNCNFSQLRLFESTTFDGVTFNGSVVDALVHHEHDTETWNPIDVASQLKKMGVTFFGDGEGIESEVIETESDPEIRDIEKVIRYFMRSTHISESVIKIKLGARGQAFLDHELPKLLQHGIMVEIENRGGSVQKRYSLKASLQTINEAIALARGSFEVFLSAFK
jgi:hypothetical protein